MAPGGFRFERFWLDPGDRRLRRDDAPVDLNARYFDALALLVREHGTLITKDRFLKEVWAGVPVTDEALTQCIKTLRRQLGDDAAQPRFIETVPKHGYRFIAPVERVEKEPRPPMSARTRPAPEAAPPFSWRGVWRLGGAGVIGAAVAGLVGGLSYGLAGASQPPGSGIGAASVLLVLLCLTLFVSLLGGAGVAFGIAAACVATGDFGRWSVLGGAAGGLVVGGVAKLLGLDAFNLLFGRAPGDITGAAEGALLGGAVGFGVWLGSRGGHSLALRRGVAAAAAAGAGAGILVPLLGGRMMGGSLDQLAHGFPDSRLQFDSIGAFFGESAFGPVSQIVTGGLEGALFGGCIVGAMILAQRGPNGRGRGAMAPPAT